MACLKLGSKSETFLREGQSWHCTSGLPSDVTIEINDMYFHLHKFPLISRIGLFEKLIAESSSHNGSVCVVRLPDIPGGANSFELIAKFCYGVKLEVTASNVASLRCATEYLQMGEDYGEGNLIAQTEGFLNEVFGNWSDTIKALETCTEVLPYTEELHIVSRCINSLAVKACADTSLFNWPVSGHNNTESAAAGNVLWNGISTANKTQFTGDDWWYEDVSHLDLPLYKQLIQAIKSGGMKPEKIAGSLVFYAKKYIPLMAVQPGFKENHVTTITTITSPSEADQKTLLENIAELLPNKKGVTPTRFLLKLLRTAMILQASLLCRENLEKMVGAQLDQAALEDLLIQNMGYSVETLYDVDCFQRILDYFMSMDEVTIASSPCIVEEGQFTVANHSLNSITMVANLVDAYLADVAPDVNLKFPKFLSLASAIPDYARPLSDGIYRAIDIYLKAHPWLTDTEREQICGLMNCQKLSLEASTHAAQNERLPLRVIVQVLFFEQLRLRTSISRWLYVSDNLENSQNPSASLGLSKANGSHQLDCAQGGVTGMTDVKERVSELEKKCQTMKQEMQKLMKTKRTWNFFGRRKSQHLDSKESKASNLQEPPPSANKRQDYKSGKLGFTSLKLG